jgi:uncharacterized protein YecT (DUF1311 family)
MTTRALLPLALALALASPACNPRSVTPTPDPAGPVPLSSSLASAPVPSASLPSASVASASPPPAASAPGGAARHPTATPAEAAELLAHAEKCLTDPTCTEDGEALFRRADDMGAAGISCFRFYHGIGVAQDLPRARACFERQVARDPGCHGSSPDLERVVLAAMLIDAQGGPADAARAEALFTDCLKDGSVTGVLEEIPKRSQPDPTRAPLDFCKDIGGTTYSISRCHGVDHDRLLDQRVRVDRLLFPRLDPTGRQLAVKAREAWSVFADKEGAVHGDKYRGGSIQSNAWASHENELQKQRADAVAHLFDHKLSPGADPAAAARDLEKAYREACNEDATRKKLCGTARKAWTTYRDAEIALYVRALGASLGEKELTRDLTTTLTRAYAADLEDVMKP